MFQEIRELKELMRQILEEARWARKEYEEMKPLLQEALEELKRLNRNIERLVQVMERCPRLKKSSSD